MQYTEETVAAFDSIRSVAMGTFANCMVKGSAEGDTGKFAFCIFVAFLGKDHHSCDFSIISYE